MRIHTASIFRSDQAENSIMQTITIAVSAILIAAGLVTAPGLINNARDNNARTDLANIAFSQEFYLGSSGEYFELDADGQPDLNPPLEGIQYSLSGSTTNHAALVCSDPEPAYLLRTTSASERTFYRASGSGLTSDTLSDLDYPQCIQDLIDADPGFEIPNAGGGTPVSPPVAVDYLSFAPAFGLNYPLLGEVGNSMFIEGYAVQPTDSFPVLETVVGGGSPVAISNLRAWIGSTEVPIGTGSNVELFVADNGDGTWYYSVSSPTQDFYVGDGSNLTMRHFVADGRLTFSANGTDNEISFSANTVSAGNLFMIYGDREEDRVWEPVVEFGAFQVRNQYFFSDDGPGEYEVIALRGFRPEMGVSPSNLPSIPIFATRANEVSHEADFDVVSITLEDGSPAPFVRNAEGDADSRDGIMGWERNASGRLTEFFINLYGVDITLDSAYALQGATVVIEADGTEQTFVLDENARGLLSFGTEELRFDIPWQ